MPENEVLSFIDSMLCTDVVQISHSMSRRTVSHPWEKKSMWHLLSCYRIRGTHIHSYIQKTRQRHASFMWYCMSSQLKQPSCWHINFQPFLYTSVLLMKICKTLIHVSGTVWGTSAIYMNKLHTHHLVSDFMATRSGKWHDRENSNLWKYQRAGRSLLQLGEWWQVSGKELLRRRHETVIEEKKRTHGKTSHSVYSVNGDEKIEHEARKADNIQKVKLYNYYQTFWYIIEEF